MNRAFRRIDENKNSIIPQKMKRKKSGKRKKSNMK